MKSIISPKEILERKIVYTAPQVLEINVEQQMQQVGIDLRLAKASWISGLAEFTNNTTTLKPSSFEMQIVDNCYFFKAGMQYSLDFFEDISVPEDMAALIINRSSINRYSGVITSGVYDPGFRSKGGCGAMFRPTLDTKIEIGFRVAQVMFFAAESASLYAGQYQDSKEKDKA
jgi:deoxycytidine triphosphate deaminase